MTALEFDLGFYGVFRARASTRIKVRLKPVEGALSITKVTGSLKLKGEADNLESELEARLVWLLQRGAGAPPEEVPHPYPVVLVPGAASGPLKAVPFEVRELHEKEKKDLSWDARALGLYGTGTVGFRIESGSPLLPPSTLAPGSSAVSFDIPLEVKLLGPDGQPPTATASLLVGSRLKVEVSNGTELDGQHVRLRVWDEARHAGLDHRWELGREVHREDFRLGVGAGGLMYTITPGASPKVKFDFRLDLVDDAGDTSPGARPARHGQIAEVSAPKLVAWAIEIVSAESAGSEGAPLVRTRGKLTNLAPDFAPALEVTLASLRPAATGQERPVPAIRVLSTKQVSVAAQSDVAGAEDSRSAPGDFGVDFVLGDDELAHLRETPTEKLFAIVSFPGPNATQPFGELVSYLPNLSGPEDDTGFAPYVVGGLTTPQLGTGVCTGLVNLQGDASGLESSATPTKAPPPWYGEPYGELTTRDGYFDMLPWEGLVPHLYRDSAKEGNITCGVGCRLESVAQAQGLGFWNTREGRKATPVEIANAWTAVSAMKPGLKADAYVLEPNIALPYEEVRKLFDQRYENFIREAHGAYPDFDSYPRSARRGLLDMLYQLGSPNLKSGFPAFNEAVKNRRWKTAAQEALNGPTADRTTWRKSLFEYAQTVETDRVAPRPVATAQ